MPLTRTFTVIGLKAQEISFHQGYFIKHIFSKKLEMTFVTKSCNYSAKTYSSQTFRTTY